MCRVVESISIDDGRLRLVSDSRVSRHYQMAIFLKSMLSTYRIVIILDSQLLCLSCQFYDCHPDNTFMFADRERP